MTEPDATMPEPSRRLMPRSTPRRASTPRRRPSRRIVAIAASIALLLALAPQAWRYGAAAGRIDSPRAEQADVIVVLGAAIWGADTPSPYLRFRLDTAAAHHHPGTPVIVSGDGRDAAWSEVAVMRSYLERAGIPAADITEDPAGLDSISTCRFARETHPGARIALVSQRYHLPRAIALCRALGVDAYGLADDEGKRFSSTWYSGVAREFLATYKAAAEALAARISR